MPQGKTVRRTLFACALLAPHAAPGQEAPSTYRNPLPVDAGALGPVESCADPSVIRGQGDDPHWTMVCTTDPLSGQDRDASGELIFRAVPMFRSRDLVNWAYQGTAFDRDPATPAPEPPAWADPASFFWAPEIEAIGGRYVLLFGVTNVTDETSGAPACETDNAIGYATSDSPTGPWTPADRPLVEPRPAAEGCDFFWTYDPEILETPEGRRYLYYGSYHGGIEVRDLEVAPDGTLSAPEETAVPITITDRYEGPEVVFHDGAYWLFVSSTNCCNGPQTGYAVFAGRSESPTGPFLDREGVSLLDPLTGGTPVIVQNGNRWVGPGHNTVLEDEAGQWWTLYHAIDEGDPWFAGEVGFTRRPVLLDPIDWVEGWPVVLGGPSDEPRPAPAAQPGEVSAHQPEPVPEPAPGEAMLTEEFDGDALSEGWTWLREPPADAWEVADGTLRIETQAADLHEDQDSASVLLTDAPEGSYAVEAKVRLDVPDEGCCHNYVQAGLVIHGDDDNYIKLSVASIWSTRQTEFAREMGPVPEGFPRYGNTVVGPPGEDWTWLRIVVERDGDGARYTAFTSRDGEAWVRGGTWTHDLGDAEIGLVSMGGAGFTAEFDHVRVHDLADSVMPE